jgi:hypothetical protein
MVLTFLTTLLITGIRVGIEISFCILQPGRKVVGAVGFLPDQILKRNVARGMFIGLPFQRLADFSNRAGVAFHCLPVDRKYGCVCVCRTLRQL